MLSFWYKNYIYIKKNKKTKNKGRKSKKKEKYFSLSKDGGVPSKLKKKKADRKRERVKK